MALGDFDAACEEAEIDLEERRAGEGVAGAEREAVVGVVIVDVVPERGLMTM